MSTAFNPAAAAQAQYSATLPQAEAPVAAAMDGGATVNDPTSDPRYRAKATEAAIKFESFFIGHMLHQMRSTTREMAGEDSIYKDSVNSDMLDMADNLVADAMATKRAFGIADAILRQLLPPPAPPAMPAVGEKNVKSA